MKRVHTTQFIGDFCSALLDAAPEVAAGQQPSVRQVVRAFDEMECEVLGSMHTASLARLVKLQAGLDEIIGDLKDEFMARAGKEWSPEMHKADEAEPDDFEILDILRESTRPVIIDAIAVAEEEARAKIRLAADNE